MPGMTGYGFHASHGQVHPSVLLADPFVDAFGATVLPQLRSAA